MNDDSEHEDRDEDRAQQSMWRIGAGVGRRKSIPKRHYVDNSMTSPESTKRLHLEDEQDYHSTCNGCESKQSEINLLKREVSQLLRLTEYQQDDIDKLKKDLSQANRRNDDLQRRVIDKMDHVVVMETNPIRTITPSLRESPRPSSPLSHHLGVHLLTQSPTMASPSVSSSPNDVKMETLDQDDFASRLGILPEDIERLLDSRHSKTISQFTKDVAVCMFGRDTLATHSLKGQMSTAHHKNPNDVKPALPAHRVESLMEFVLSVYPSTERKIIKCCLREKLNDESKLMKKRLQKEYGQSVSQVVVMHPKSYRAAAKKESGNAQYSDDY